MIFFFLTWTRVICFSCNLGFGYREKNMASELTENEEMFDSF